MASTAEEIPSEGGWRASLRLGFRPGARGTVLAERRRLGPLAVQRPFYPEGEVCHTYLLHPPGGVVGGDRLDIEVEMAAGTRALITTPGAGKFYRSAGASAEQEQHLRAASGASLEWLPQENILFPGAEVRMRTRVELQGDARLVLWEIQCLGRPAIGEAFEHGRLDSRLSIYRDGTPLLLERLRVNADNRCRLSLMAGLAVGGILVISNAGEPEVETCRDLLLGNGSDYSGVTLIEDLLLVRYLGNSTENARRLFASIWQRLRPRTLGRAPNTPRIWAT